MFRRGEVARTTKASGPDLDPGAPTLTSLAPRYEFVDHGVYFTILHEALLNRPTVLCTATPLLFTAYDCHIPIDSS